jgi:hypothetical protein
LSAQHFDENLDGDRPIYTPQQPVALRSNFGLSLFDSYRFQSSSALNAEENADGPFARSTY